MKTFDQVWEYTSQVGGYFSIEEARVLWEEASRLGEGDLVVEIGVYRGRSTSVLLQAAQQTGSNLVVIDPWCWMNDIDRIEREFREMVGTDFADILHRVMILKMPSQEAIGCFSNGAFGDDGPLVISFLHIDGNHDPECVERDCDLWIPHLKPGGVVCFHDYGNSALRGVAEAVDRKAAEMGLIDCGVFNSLAKRRKPE